MRETTKVFVWLKRLLQKPEYFFVIIAALAGLTFLFIVPPLQTPDANVHFYRAYEVSELKFSHIRIGNEVGNYLPSSIRQTETAVLGTYGLPGEPGHISFNPNVKYKLIFTRAALHIPLKKNVRMFYPTAGAPSYFPLSYLPQAIVIKLLSLFNAPIIAMIYGARLINLMLWLVLSYFAIRMFPFKRWALVSICLLPVVVSQTISLGLDAGILGATVLFLSMIFRKFAEKRPLHKSQAVVLFLTGLTMIFGKLTLVLLLPLIFILPTNRTKWIRSNYIKITIALVPIVLYFVWQLIAAGSNSPIDRAHGATQFHNLLYAPWHFTSSLFNTLFFITPSGNILAQSIIGDFGWLDTPLSPFFIASGYIILSIVLLANYEPAYMYKIVSKSIRRASFVLCVAYTLATFCAMYVYFTPPGANHIGGVEGRYLVPVMFLLVPALFNGAIKMKELCYIRLVKYGSIYLLLASIATIIARYYVVFTPKL